MERRARVWLGLLGTVALGAACAEYVVAPQERTPRALQLDATQYTVDEGQQVRVLATVLDQFGAAFSDVPAGVTIGWASSDSAVLTVSGEGVLTGVSAGVAEVTAAVRGPFGQITVAADVTVRPLVSSMAIAAGDSQTGTVGQALPTRLQVRVLNRLGTGVKGIAVNFTVTAGGGSLDTAGATTDTAGIATAGLTLGTKVGTDSVQASTPR